MTKLLAAALLCTLIACSRGTEIQQAQRPRAQVPPVLPPFEAYPIAVAMNQRESLTYNPRDFAQSFRGTGPFVRIGWLTKYSATRATVTLPCHNPKLHVHELAYAYLGGWGANAHGGDPGVVDAGLFETDHPDWYRLFIAYFDKTWTPRADGNVKGTMWQNDPDKSKYLPCGRPIDLVFAPTSHGTVRITASALGSRGDRIDSAAEQPVRATDGWWPQGDPHADLHPKSGYPEGVLVKVMTSIAQDHEVVVRRDWATSGSYFGGRTAPIVWSNLYVGRIARGQMQWVPWSSAGGIAVQNQWPDADRAYVRYFSGRYETAIVLHGGPPAVPCNEQCKAVGFNVKVLAQGPDRRER